MAAFSDRLAAAQRASGSALCVGLDPDVERLPPHLLESRTPVAAVEHFCRSVIEHTSDSACAYKLNFAFFERLGDSGLALLRRIRRAVPSEKMTVADAKRGDIGNSARFYAKSALEDLGFDSVTVSPYMGRDSVLPFIESDGHAAFVLAHTSNPGREDFQTARVNNRPLYEVVVERCLQWGREAKGEIGFVVGASEPGIVARLRELAPESPFLIPGVGAQGGSAEAAMEASKSTPGITLVNSSRAIIYASAGTDYAEAAGQAAREAAGLLGIAEGARV